VFNQYGPGGMGGRPASYHNPGAFELDRKITLQFAGEHLDAKDRGTLASTSFSATLPARFLLASVNTVALGTGV